MPRTHRTSENDFRQEAVNLLLRSGRSLQRVAAELGISANSLRTWRDRALGKGRGAEARSAPTKGRSVAPMAAATGESRRLQRDVLKKAMRILSEEPPSGMRCLTPSGTPFSVANFARQLGASRSGHATAPPRPGRFSSLSKPKGLNVRGIWSRRFSVWRASVHFLVRWWRAVNAAWRSSGTMRWRSVRR